MSRIISLLFLLFQFQTFLSAQIVTTDPVFPRLNDAVTITFDATQGTGGLADCNCDVYLHTGVITTQSTTPSDWKHVVTTWGVANPAWKLTPVPGQPNLFTYSISPSIKQFYSVGNGETVEKLAMVFRNADGSLEGKEVGNADIFYPVYPDDLPFTSVLLSPSENSLILGIGETIDVKAATSENATFSLFDNGNLLNTASGISFEFTIPVVVSGTHVVELVADNGSTQISNAFNYVVPNSGMVEEVPAGADLGINLLGDTSLILALFAPNKDNVFLLGDFNDWTLNTDFQLRNTPDGDTWWIQVDGLIPGDYYRFQYLVDGAIKIGDPYSTQILDESNDPFIPAETFPNLPPYPSGKTTGLVSLIQPGAPQYQWQANDFQPPAKEDLVVYELLLRDFIQRHDYPTLIDTLNYLQTLGVNAIELMPVSEFEGNISWGYNPSFHMALDKYYGAINDFKRFIDACHARGIAIILDVVYNHAFGQNPLVQLYFDGKPTLESPWFNRDATHPFNVGFDFNHESQATKTYIKKVMKYWLQEFRIDGFRFDLSKGFTQTPNPNNAGAWAQFDQSRIDILSDYANSVWATNPEAYVILEHFAVNSEETALINKGMMVWGNMNFSYNEASMGFPNNNLTGASYTSRGWQTPNLVSYMESHDEERLMYKNLSFGNSNANYNIKNLHVALRRQELVSNFYYTIPGPKMLWQFGELGYDVSIGFGGRTSPKPIKWGYFEVPDRRRLYDVTRSLIHLRENYEVFKTTDFSLDIGSGFLKSIYLNGAEMDVAVLGNFNILQGAIDPQFQHPGIWYDYFTGDSISVSNFSSPIDLAPGEYRLYTDQKLPEPPAGYLITTGIEELTEHPFGLDVRPNPANETSAVSYSLKSTAEVNLAIYDIAGRLQAILVNEKQAAGPHDLVVKNKLAPGSYVLYLETNQEVEAKRFIIVEK